MSTVQLVVAGLLVAAFALFLWAIMSKPDIEEVPAIARGALLESHYAPRVIVIKFLLPSS